MHQPDLQVSLLSKSLENKHIDVIVSGSIGATEAVKFIRSLRRLGAEVTPWLTEGGSQFTTVTALTWASGNETITQFSATASHVAEHDACIIAPASANMIESIARGVTNTPATALVQSYLGQKLPVMLVPNMHQSLFDSPIVQRNLETIKDYVKFFEPRSEEGKLKFPDPKILADELSHYLNRNPNNASTMITLGSTKGYFDDVRYLSNYSSGRLGSLIAEEFYRFGHATEVIAGSSTYRPQSYTNLIQAEENESMEAAVGQVSSDVGIAVMAASVLDFVPKTRNQGKVKSTSGPQVVELINTPKIIKLVDGHSCFKVGFKLETELNDDKVLRLADDYFSRYNLSLFILNELKNVNDVRHVAYAAMHDNSGGYDVATLSSKEEIARFIVAKARGESNY